MARHTLARIAVAALAARTAALSGLDRRAALRWSAGAGALVAEQAFAADAPAAEPPVAAPPAADAKPAPAKLFDVTLPFKGKDVPLSKFRGDAHLVVNIKMDDPVAGANFNAMRYAAKEYPGADAASSLNLTRSRRWRLRDAPRVAARASRRWRWRELRAIERTLPRWRWREPPRHRAMSAS